MPRRSLSPDGAKLIFRTNRKGLMEFYQKSAFGGGNEEPVLTVEAQRAVGKAVNLVPTDWSPDGRDIIYSVGEGYFQFCFRVCPLVVPVDRQCEAGPGSGLRFRPNARKFLAPRQARRIQLERVREVSSVCPNISAIRPEMAGLD